MEIASYACFAVGAAFLVAGSIVFIAQITARLRRALDVFALSRRIARYP
jgi:hypothetical protein